jgi:hypothetical protein
MKHRVHFIRLLQEDYDGLAEKDANSVYWTTDTGRIYLGDTKYADGTIPLEDFIRNSSDETQRLDGNLAFGRDADGQAYRLLGIARDNAEHSLIKLAELENNTVVEIGSEDAYSIVLHKEAPGSFGDHPVVAIKHPDGSVTYEPLLFTKDILTATGELGDLSPTLKQALTDADVTTTTLCDLISFVWEHRND